MIGVIARNHELELVHEFFELFKTPWESWSPEHCYDVVLCTTEECIQDLRAKLILIYSGGHCASDPADVIEEKKTNRTTRLRHHNDVIPIYGRCLTFPPDNSNLLMTEASGRPVTLRQTGNQEEEILRIGYDLFEEVRFLLTTGQPRDEAGFPTLDLHIDFLRNQMHASGIEFIEIPPVPQGYQFMVCLTHDVDHPAIRRHRSDHTAAGFLYRASIGSILGLMRGQLSFQSLVENCIAVAKWPLVQLGLARDFWADFANQYRQIEGGLPSTYFVIPFAGESGRGLAGASYKRRASAYGARDIEPVIREIQNSGSEVALHGLDAWLDSDSAVLEIDEIRKLTGKSEIGVRMHWLCFNVNSPRELEQAGATFDSTIGYRETVGYRTGTTQPYMPLGAQSIIELPLHAMDTALFYPAYLGLRPQRANDLLANLVRNATRFGGCLTVNWHDRSLAPERQWFASYRQFLDEAASHKVWFTTCSEAAAWFRKRRSVTFKHNRTDVRADCAEVNGKHNRLPDLALRIHTPLEHPTVAARNERHVEHVPLKAELKTELISYQSA